MLKNQIVFFIGVFLNTTISLSSSVHAWECEDDRVAFTHSPSDYYGSGEYFAACPESDLQIRCYHYHRHWICVKENIYYWDRNLESAARTACNCPLPEGMAPASPAISKEPNTRLYNVPEK